MAPSGLRMRGVPMLSPQELERYARHIVLHEIGGPGQQALKQARVLVVGAGGLGAPALLYLAAAGVGTLGVIDDDAVALSNLQRQVIHGTPEIGGPKVESAAAAIRRLNPHVTVETHAARLVAANALALIGRYDVVADGSDNFATRYLVSDACFFAKKPLAPTLWRRSHFVQVATAVVPFITDHLLSPAVRMRKQLALEPCQVVQKPSLVSFQVPSALEPPALIGSRIILPSGLNVILYLILVAAAVKG